MGGLAPGGLVRRDISIKRPPLKPKEEWASPDAPESDESAPMQAWTDETLTIHIRKRSAIDFYELVAAEDRQKPFMVIFRCVCQENGQPVFSSFEQVEQLRPWLWMPMATAAQEVNKTSSKNSQPKTNSGMSSPSSSAARSQKLARASRKKSSGTGPHTGRSAAP
jgi:hypothetical protein